MNTFSIFLYIQFISACCFSLNSKIKVKKKEKETCNKIVMNF